MHIFFINLLIITTASLLWGLHQMTDRLLSHHLRATTAPGQKARFLLSSLWVDAWRSCMVALLACLWCRTRRIPSHCPKYVRWPHPHTGSTRWSRTVSFNSRGCAHSRTNSTDRSPPSTVPAPRSSLPASPTITLLWRGRTPSADSFASRRRVGLATAISGARSGLVLHESTWSFYCTRLWPA